MRGFDNLVRQGKILYAGVLDAPAWWVAQANTLASLRGWSPFIALQIEYSLAERTVERELLPMAKALGLGLAAGRPLPPRHGAGTRVWRHGGPYRGMTTASAAISRCGLRSTDASRTAA